MTDAASSDAALRRRSASAGTAHAQACESRRRSWPGMDVYLGRHVHAARASRSEASNARIESARRMVVEQLRQRRCAIFAYDACRTTQSRPHPLQDNWENHQNPLRRGSIAHWSRTHGDSLRPKRQTSRMSTSTSPRCAARFAMRSGVAGSLSDRCGMHCTSETRHS